MKITSLLLITSISLHPMDIASLLNPEKSGLLNIGADSKLSEESDSTKKTTKHKRQPRKKDTLEIHPICNYKDPQGNVCNYTVGHHVKYKASALSAHKRKRKHGHHVCTVPGCQNISSSGNEHRKHCQNHWEQIKTRFLIKAMEKTSAYQCQLCPYYSLQGKSFKSHLLRIHNETNGIEIEKFRVYFDQQSRANLSCTGVSFREDITNEK